jgi:hypothetical protein
MAVPHLVTLGARVSGHDELGIVEAAVAHINRIAGDMVLRAYEIGRYVWETVLQKGRAPYGRGLVDDIASHPDLAMSRSSLFNCISLARSYPELGCGRIPERIRGLSLSHLQILSRVADPEDRRWFEHKALKEKWAVRKLERYCVMRDYRAPTTQEAAAAHDGAADGVLWPARVPPVHLEAGVHWPADLLRTLAQVGPASFRVAPPKSQLGGWDKAARDCGLGCVSIQDLCLLRAFVEIVASRRGASLTLENRDGCLVASTDGLSLRIECMLLRPRLGAGAQGAEPKPRAGKT